MSALRLSGIWASRDLSHCRADTLALVAAGDSIPNRMEKEVLSRECGVAVRSIEYWFWARNKKLRADPNAFSPGGSRNPIIKSPPNPENHWSSWDPKRPREDDGAKLPAQVISTDDDWMSDPVDNSKRPAAAPVAAGADSLLSSGSAPQQLQDLLGNAASRFPNVEIPSDTCTEHSQDTAEESPLQINSANSATTCGTSWTDGPDSMEPGCWGWNEEHANGSDNTDGMTARNTPTTALHWLGSIWFGNANLAAGRSRWVHFSQTMIVTAHPSLCGYPLPLVDFLQKRAEKHFIAHCSAHNSAHSTDYMHG